MATGAMRTAAASAASAMTRRDMWCASGDCWYCAGGNGLGSRVLDVLRPVPDARRRDRRVASRQRAGIVDDARGKRQSDASHKFVACTMSLRGDGIRCCSPQLAAARSPASTRAAQMHRGPAIHCDRRAPMIERVALSARAGLLHVLSSGTLRALHDVELHRVTLGQALEAVALDGAVVHEAILAVVVGRDEAEALGVVEPLDLAGRAH